MRFIAYPLAMAAFAAAIPATLFAEPIQIKNLNSFAIKPSDLPSGCTINRFYDSKHDRMLPTITCPSQELFTSGFAIPASLKATCETQDGKYVCKVTDND